MIEGPCDCNPWSQTRLPCPKCSGLGRLAKTRGAFESVPCPSCSDPNDRERLWTEKNRATLPALRLEDLTPEEQAAFRDWRGRNHHELDCLRWVEGRRYDPWKDPDFLNACNRALKKAAFLHSQPEPSFAERYKARMKAK